MGIISDAEWAEIREAAGGLPDVARDEVTAAIRAFREDEGKEFEVRSWVVKADIDEALKHAKKLLPVLNGLAKSENYRCYNTEGKPVSMATLENARDAVSRLCDELTLDRQRFRRKNKKDRERMRKIDLVRSLLEIQQRYLSTKLPVQFEETTTGVRFRKYVEKCAGFGGHGLDRVLKVVTREFARQRKTARR